MIRPIGRRSTRRGLFRLRTFRDRKKRKQRRRGGLSTASAARCRAIPRASSARPDCRPGRRWPGVPLVRDRRASPVARTKTHTHKKK